MYRKFGIKCFGTLAVAAFGLMSLSGPASAAGLTLKNIFDNSGIVVSGDLQASYFYRFGHGQNINGDFFNNTSNSFKFNQGILKIAYQPTDGFGAVTKIIAGDDATFFNQVYGDGTSNSKFSLDEAYVQYAHGPFLVKAGRFESLQGYETYDAEFNTSISHSYIFGLAESYVHTGIRGFYTVGDGVTLVLGINNASYGNFDTLNSNGTPGGPFSSSVNGVSNDNNNNKDIEAGFSVASFGPVPLFLSFYNDYSYDTTANSRNFSDLVAIYTVNPKLTLGANADWYHGHGLYSGNPTYYGVALYGTYQFTQKWKAQLRGEGGRGNAAAGAGCTTSGSCNLYEVTATVGYTPVPNFTLLGELRQDYGTSDSFSRYAAGVVPAMLRQNQANVGVSAIYYW